MYLESAESNANFRWAHYTIFPLSFDGRYKYLFSRLKNKNNAKRVQRVSPSKRVPSKFRFITFFSGNNLYWNYYGNSLHDIFPCDAYPQVNVRQISQVLLKVYSGITQVLLSWVLPEHFWQPIEDRFLQIFIALFLWFLGFRAPLLFRKYSFFSPQNLLQTLRGFITIF